MFFVIFISILIVNVSGNLNHNHEYVIQNINNCDRSNFIEPAKSSENFYVELAKDSHFGKSHHYDSDSNYDFQSGETIELTCHRTYPKLFLTLQWKESERNVTKQHEGYGYAALRIRLKIDDDNMGLRLTCHAYEPSYKNLTITFNKKYTGTKVKGEEIFLQPQQNYTADENCTGLLRYLNETAKLIEPYERVLSNFDEKLDGTKLFCMRYKYLGCIKSEINSQQISPLIETYEKVKRKYIFKIKNDNVQSKNKEVYYDAENEFQDSVEPKSTEQNTKNEKTDLSNGESGNTSDVKENGSSDSAKDEGSSDSSAVAIVGGVLGTIIFILLSILLTIWYKKTIRRSNFDGAEDQVIYAEIEDSPPKLPPPRRPESPYAKILGTLVPKTQQQTNENLYSEMN